MNQGKPRKASKKKKLSWRKNINISDVEKYLVDERQNERIGDLSKKTNSQLFYDDKTPQSLSKSEKRLLLKSKSAKCFEILKNTSAVADPITKRNRVRSRCERKSEIRVEIEERRRAMGIIRRKELISMKDRKKYEESLKNKGKKDADTRGDVWEDRLVHSVDTNTLGAAALRHTLIHMGIKKRKPLKRIRSSVLPPIELPHPGTSYNPSYEDHQDLLREVAEKEEKLMKEEEHLERVTTKMFRKVSQTEKEQVYIDEMSEGLNITSQTKEMTNSEEENMDDSVINQKVNKNIKKTKVQRRKLREEKLLKLSLQSAKTEKKKTSDIYRLKQIKSQIDKDECLKRVNRERREKKKEREDSETKRLNKRKFDKADEDFLMANELTGNLRNISSVGNLLKDRFLRLQERNVLAPSVMRTTERAKIKRFIKPDHKINLQPYLK